MDRPDLGGGIGAREVEHETATDLAPEGLREVGTLAYAEIIDPLVPHSDDGEPQGPGVVMDAILSCDQFDDCP